MPRVSVTIPRLRLFRLRMARYGLLLRRNIRERMEEAVGELEQEVQDQLRRGPRDVKGGGARLEDVKLGKNPTSHLRIRSGRLIGSIRGRVTGRGVLVEGRVGPQRVSYAAIHEFGGKAGRAGSVDIKARPYLSPALRAKQEDLLDIVGKSLRLSGIGRQS